MLTNNFNAHFSKILFYLTVQYLVDNDNISNNKNF